MVQTQKVYEQLTEGIALLKILSMGEKSIQDGKGIPAAEAFARETLVYGQALILP
jgi:hypothetical protein